MIVKVYQKEENIFLVIDGKNIFDSIDFRTKSNLLENAINSLQNDITETADKFKTSRFYHLYWCHTYLPHRDDGLRGTVLDYYFIELVKFVLTENKKITSVVFETFVPTFLIRHLKRTINTKFERNIDYKTLITNHLRRYAPLSHIFKYLKSSINKTQKLSYFNFNNSILFFGSTKSTFRLKGFTKLFNENKIIIDESFCSLRDLENNKLYKISLFKIKHFIYAFLKTIKFQFEKRYSSKLKHSNLFVNYVYNQSFLQSYFVILREKALNDFLGKHKFNFIVSSTNFGDPLRRQYITVSNKYNHKTVNFACRPMYSHLRAEDNAIKPDFHNQNAYSSLPDAHIIFDKVSYKHLINHGIDKTKIVHYNSPIKVDKKKEVKDGILILFAHNRYNNQIINTLYEFRSKGLKFNKIHFREHPVVALTANQKNKLKDLSDDVVNISNYFWHEISLVNTICFTSNSTSAIDALSKGAGVLWLPFLSYHAIQFQPIMSLVGKIINSKKEFYRVLKELEENQNSKKSFINKCQIDYNTNIQKDDEMIEFNENFVKSL